MSNRHEISFKEQSITGDCAFQQHTSVESEECPVNSWNEWDPLEEVIVGIAWGAHIPPSSDGLSELSLSKLGMGGQPFPFELAQRVQEQVDNLALTLMREGVTVRRPIPFDLATPVITPFFSASCGYNFMNPRDLVLIVGNQIIEAPTASRTRYFETLAELPPEISLPRVT